VRMLQYCILLLELCSIVGQIFVTLIKHIALHISDHDVSKSTQHSKDVTYAKGD